MFQFACPTDVLFSRPRIMSLSFLRGKKQWRAQELQLGNALFVYYVVYPCAFVLNILHLCYFIQPKKTMERMRLVFIFNITQSPSISISAMLSPISQICSSATPPPYPYVLLTFYQTNTTYGYPPALLTKIELCSDSTSILYA